jgi:hypothetical protein
MADDEGRNTRAAATAAIFHFAEDFAFFWRSISYTCAKHTPLPTHTPHTTPHTLPMPLSHHHTTQTSSSFLRSTTKSISLCWHRILVGSTISELRTHEFRTTYYRHICEQNHRTHDAWSKKRGACSCQTPLFWFVHAAHHHHTLNASETHTPLQKKKKKCDESDSVCYAPRRFSNSKAFCPRTTESAGLGVTESSILSFSSSFSISPR